jgi:hypothetical protein
MIPARRVGTVTSWRAPWRSGFLGSDGQEFLFLPSSLSGRRVYLGDRVEFDVGENPRGDAPLAINVAPLVAGAPQLFVGNLSYKIETEESLKAGLERLIGPVLQAWKRPSWDGFGYVIFRELADHDRALTENFILEGRALRFAARRNRPD